MAHSLSSKKRIRQNITRRSLNRARRSTLRSKLRKCDELFLRGGVAEAETAFRDVGQALDREASCGLIHRNAAARRKSRMARRLNALKAKAS